METMIIYKGLLAALGFIIGLFCLDYLIEKTTTTISAWTKSPKRKARKVIKLLNALKNEPGMDYTLTSDAIHMLNKIIK